MDTVAKYGIPTQRPAVRQPTYLRSCCPAGLVDSPLGWDGQREMAATYANLRHVRKLGEGRQVLLGSLQTSALNGAFTDL
jgi:hypothetical protein